MQEHDVKEDKPVECIGCGKDSGLIRCERCGFYFCPDCEGKMKDCK